MDFVFPENKVIHYGAIRSFAVNRNRQVFSDIDIMNPNDNIITIDNVDYCFTYLSFDESGNKGGNSIILKLFSVQNLDVDNVEYGDPDLVLKILRFPKRRKLSKAHLRFSREINALFECKFKKMQNVIEIFHSGECKIFNPEKNTYEIYFYYTMEYARFDLKSYVETNFSNLNYENKLSLCISLSEGLKELYSLDIYHRDLKPDNIFVTDNGRWKIADLGLIDSRIEDFKIDSVSDFIGPKGWLSPESMNQYLCEKKGFHYRHDCIIDHQSDIFQLGKIFWYVFQHNAPVGTVKEADFLIRNSQLFSIFKTMLNFSKIRRYKAIDEVIILLKQLERKALKMTH